VKKCDRGLQNAFSRPRSQFFTTRTDPRPVNTLFIFFLPKFVWAIYLNQKIVLQNLCLRAHPAHSIGENHLLSAVYTLHSQTD